MFIFMHLNVVFVRTQWNFFFRTTFTLILWMIIVLTIEVADLMIYSFIKIPLIYENLLNNFVYRY